MPFAESATCASFAGGLMLAFLATLPVLAWLGMLLGLLLSIGLALLQPTLRRRKLIDAAPPVTIVIPTKGEEPGLALALESALRQMRPHDELIVACAEPDGWSLPVARSCFARYPGIDAKVYVGSAPLVRSPKMNNLLGPIAVARNDLIFCKDANAILSDGQLVDYLRHLAPGVGLVTTIVRAEHPASMAARVEAAIMNAYHARLLLSASALGLGFGLGKVMLFSRAAFYAAGGAAAMADAVHEDNAMGELFARANLRTIIAGGAVGQDLGARSFADVWHRQVRWMICRRFDEPVSLLLEPCAAALLPTLVALAFSGPSLAVCTAGAWYLAETLFLALKGWRLMSPVAFVARELLLPAMWLRAWTSETVVWAGEHLNARRTRRC